MHLWLHLRSWICICCRGWCENDDNWNLNGAIGLNDVERLGAKRFLREFQDSRRSKKRDLPGIVADVFVRGFRLVNLEAPEDVSPLEELVSIKKFHSSAQAVSKKAKEKESFSTEETRYVGKPFASII